MDGLQGPWVPVPLESKFCEDGVYCIVMLLPAAVMGAPNFEAMCHDEWLRNADADGVIVEGQPLIRAEVVALPSGEAVDVQVQVAPSLVEGEHVEPFRMSERERAMRERVRGNIESTVGMLGMDIGEVLGPGPGEVLRRADPNQQARITVEGIAGVVL